MLSKFAMLRSLFRVFAETIGWFSMGEGYCENEELNGLFAQVG